MIYQEISIMAAPSLLTVRGPVAPAAVGGRHHWGLRPVGSPAAPARRCPDLGRKLGSLARRGRALARASSGAGASGLGAPAAAGLGSIELQDCQPVLAADPTYRDPTPLPPPPTSASAGQVMWYLLRLAFGEAALTWRLLVALALLAISKAAGIAAPFYFKRAVDSLSAGSSVTSATAAAAAALLLTGGCRVVNGIAKELQGPVFAPVAQHAGRRVSFYTFSHVLALDLAFHLNRKTGSLSRMLERGARSVAMIFRAIVFTFLPTAVELAAVCVILARAFHPRVSALVLATFGAYAAWTVVLTRVAAGIRRRVKDLDNEITGKAVDAFLNFETVKLFGNAALEVRQYDSSLTAYQRSVVRLDYAAAALNAGQAFILAAGMTGAMLAAALGPAAPAAAAAAGAGTAAAAGAAVGAISAGDLVMIQGLLLQLWAPLQFLGWFYRELRQSLVDMEDLLRLLRMPSTLPDGHRLLPDAPAAAAPAAVSDAGDGSSAASGLPLQQQQQQGQEEWGALEERRASNGAATTTTSSSSSSSDFAAHPSRTDAASSMVDSSSSTRSSRGLRLELKDVHFSYEGASVGGGRRQVLKGVSLVAEPGESIAVVGPSGGGKSTLLRLLVRLYDCEDGAVLLNGVDVRELQQESLRGAVAVVPQDTVLFNDTILHNVAYGRPGATWAEVKAAAAAAKLDAAVARMPAGWHTVVGERGLKLSGGEKQRVAIARAFLRRPRLLICDEATSALDTATERDIQASLKSLAAGRTAVFVAHRLSTVQGCDRIYVLADGQVAEQGTHQQLMDARGIYYDMWQMQRAQRALEHHLRHEEGDANGSLSVGSGDEATPGSVAQDGMAGESQSFSRNLQQRGSVHSSIGEASRSADTAGASSSSGEEDEQLPAELGEAAADVRHRH